MALALTFGVGAYQTKAQTVIGVDDDAGLAGHGLSWETGYEYIEYGLGVAVNADDVRGADGASRTVPVQDQSGWDKEDAFGEVVAPQECEVECEDGAVPEGEVDCYELYVDTYNRGCVDGDYGVPDGGVVTITPAQCLPEGGVTFCGTSGNYHVVIWHCDGGYNDGELCSGPGDPFCDPGDGECVGVCTTDDHCGPGNICDTAVGECLVRDRDWYEVHTTDWMTMTWTAEGEFPMIAGLVEMAPNWEGSGDCSDITGYIDPVLLPGPCVQESVEIVLPPGTHWWYAAAQMDSNTDCGSTYNVTLECDVLPCPDTCDDAFVIERLPFTTVRPTTICNDYYFEDCREYIDSPGSPDAVYKYTPTCDQAVEIDLSESNFTTNVYVYENTCPPPILNRTEPTNTEYGCAEYPNPHGGNPYQGWIENLPLTADNTYYVVVDGFGGGDSGNYVLHITRLPGECDEINGPISKWWGPIPSQQCEAGQTYLAVADDFCFDADGDPYRCVIEYLDIGIRHWLHSPGCDGAGTRSCYDSPEDYDGIRVTFYEDETSGAPDYPHRPAGHPNQDGTHSNALYDLTLTPAQYTWTPEASPTQWTTWWVSLDLRSYKVTFNKNTRYWLSVAPQVCPGDYYVTGAAFTETVSNTQALIWDESQQPPAWVWDEWEGFGGVPWPELDWSFTLIGHKGGGVCDSEDDPDLWCCDPANYGLYSAPPVGLCHRNVCDPEHPDADPTTGCVCVDILHGDVYLVPGGDGAVDGFDILCILDAASDDNSWGCLNVLCTGLMAGDIYPCGVGDGAVEGFDILAVLDAANQIEWCPPTCVCP